MTREELQHLHDRYKQTGRYSHLLALADGVHRFLAEPDPTVEIAYLRASLADCKAERDAAQAEASRLPGMLSMKWDGGRCAVLDADQRIVGYLPPGRQAAGAAASALREAADDFTRNLTLMNEPAIRGWLRGLADAIESGAES